MLSMRFDPSLPPKSRTVTPISVLIVDDHSLFRAALRALLTSEPDITIVAEAHDERSALAALTSEVDVLLIDIRLGGPNGIALLREIRRRGIDTPALMLTMHDESEFVVDAMAAGAHGYALKTAQPPELIDAIKHVAARQRYLAPELRWLHDELQSRPAAGGVLGRLSAREREIFDLLVNGSSNADIAQQLFISVKTVETHRMRIFRKLGVNSLAALTRLAARHHLVAGA